MSGRLTNLWRTRNYLLPYRWEFVSLVVAGLASTAAGMAIPLVTQRVIDGPVAHRDEQGLWLLGALALTFGVVEAALNFLRRWVTQSAAFGLEKNLRDDLYAQLQRLSVGFHDGWQSGQLLSRATTDLGVIRRFLSFGLIFGVINGITFLSVSALLLHIFWPLALVVLASAVPLFLISKHFTARYNVLARKLQDEQGDLATLVEETAGGIRVVKAFGRRPTMATRYAGLATRVRDTAVDKAELRAATWPRFDLVPTTALGITLVGGSVAVAGGHLTAGALVAFISLQLMLTWPIDSLGFIIASAEEAMTAADRVFEVMDTEPEIVDRPGAVALAATARGAVRFEGVAFRYPDTDQPVLRDITLDVRPGETLAIVGATGSGKTTLISLVPRLIDPTAGRVTLDGHDLRDLRLDSLRGAIGVAFEDATLFSMSVRENLTLGRPHATDADVDEALEVAQAGFVRDLPWGLSTRVGEQGLSLSGGQRQRLALARAVLGKPSLLVLDDPLSALDVHTEELVEAALRRVLAGTTAIIVVHRPSTVALADRVALLQDGVIAAIGTHSELLATVPAYRDVLSAADTEVPA